MDTRQEGQVDPQAAVAPSRPKPRAVAALLGRLKAGAAAALGWLRSRVAAVERRTSAIVVSALAVSLLVFGLSALRFFNLLWLDDLAEAYAISYMKNYVDGGAFRKDIKIILIEEKPREGGGPHGDIDKKHRAFFAKLVGTLGRAPDGTKAKVLAFDISFEGNAPDFDQQFGDAIGDAQKGGPKVVVGVDAYANGKTDPEIPEKLREHVGDRWGMIYVGGSQAVDGPIRTMRLADPAADGAETAGGCERPAVPSLAVQVIMQTHGDALTPLLNECERSLVLRAGGPGGVVFRAIPVESGANFLIEQADAEQLKDARLNAQAVDEELDKIGKLDRPEDKAAALESWKDKIVLVGYEQGESRETIAGGRRLGVEIHATTISNILNGIYIFKLPAFYNYLIILLMSLLAAFLYTRVGRWLDFKIPVKLPGIEGPVNIPVALFIVIAIYLIAAFLTYKEYKVLFDVCYHVAAFVITYWLIFLVLKKKFPAPA